MDWLQQGLVAPAAIMLGLIGCFFGARTHRLLLGAAGLLAGAAAGWVSAQFLGVVDPGIIGVISLTLGCVGAALAIAVCKAGVFLAGAWLGALAVAIGAATLSFELPAWVVPLGGFTGGAMAVAMMRTAVIVTSAVFGSVMAVVGFLKMTLGVGPDALTAESGLMGPRLLLPALAATAALAIAGLASQSRASKPAQ